MFDSCIDDSYDAEPIEVGSRRIRKARKKHRCQECWELICPGEQYEYVKGLCDGSWFSHKTCMSCVTMRDSIFHSWIYEQLWESFEYTYGFSPFEVPDAE